MAKNITKSAIDWAKLEKLVPPEQKANFWALKAKNDSYLRRVLTNPPEAPKIDWEGYKKSVPVPGLVDKLMSEYNSFKVPYPDDKYSQEVDKQWESIQPEINAYCAKMKTHIDSATKELARIKALPKIDEMTMEMFYDMYPSEAIDFVKKPSFWPHCPDEQLGYKDPTTKIEH